MDLSVPTQDLELFQLILLHKTQILMVLPKPQLVMILVPLDPSLILTYQKILSSL